mmetsp:Transcript_127831/g.368086  ORF Transcript_127831/g.368086 Transcript_127831/m.368086 type:complete len:202 (+) Transcript_127831:258-863(+)
MVRDDSEEAPGAIHADQAIPAPLVRVREAAAAAAQRVPLGVENGDPDAVLEVAQALDPEARPRGRRVNNRRAVPTLAAHLFHRRALHGQVLRVAHLDGTDRRQPPHSLPLQDLAAELDLGRRDLLQGSDVQVLRDDLAGEWPHLSDELLARHLGVTDAGEQALCLLVVRAKQLLGGIRPMPVPAHERLEEVDLVNPRLIGL